MYLLQLVEHRFRTAYSDENGLAYLLDPRNNGENMLTDDK